MGPDNGHDYYLDFPILFYLVLQNYSTPAADQSLINTVKNAHALSHGKRMSFETILLLIECIFYSPFPFSWNTKSVPQRLSVQCLLSLCFSNRTDQAWANFIYPSQVMIHLSQLKHTFTIVVKLCNIRRNFPIRKINSSETVKQWVIATMSATCEEQRGGVLTAKALKIVQTSLILYAATCILHNTSVRM